VSATATTLAKYQMYIGGQWVDASSRDHFESDDPFQAAPWALIPRGTADDVDRAVRAAHRAFTSGEWPALTASKRGALLRHLGDLITERSKTLAEIEVRDNGNPDRQGRHLQLHALRTARRRCRNRAVEFAAAAPDVETRAGARGRQHDGHQAIGVHVGVHARIHEAD
jgi:acyl-CoA reductase-like NAD-dependent aldehyde dehydrogenase